MAEAGDPFAPIPFAALLYITLYGVAGVIGLFSIWLHLAFLNRYKSIAGEAEIEAYKDLVRGSMHKALARLIILLLANVLGILWLLSQGVAVILPMLVVNFSLAMIGLMVRRFERYAASLPTGSEELENEYKRITESGKRRFIPDF